MLLMQLRHLAFAKAPAELSQMGTSVNLFHQIFDGCVIFFTTRRIADAGGSDSQALSPEADFPSFVPCNFVVVKMISAAPCPVHQPQGRRRENLLTNKYKYRLIQNVCWSRLWRLAA